MKPFGLKLSASTRLDRHTRNVFRYFPDRLQRKETFFTASFFSSFHSWSGKLSQDLKLLQEMKHQSYKLNETDTRCTPTGLRRYQLKQMHGFYYLLSPGPTGFFFFRFKLIQGFFCTWQVFTCSPTHSRYQSGSASGCSLKSRWERNGTEIRKNTATTLEQGWWSVEPQANRNVGPFIKKKKSNNWCLV